TSHVDVFVLPLLLAGLAVLAVTPGPVAVVLAAVEQACPRLRGLVEEGGRLAPEYLLSLDGQEFVTDLSRELPAGTRLLLLSADARGRLSTEGRSWNGDWCSLRGFSVLSFKGGWGRALVCVAQHGEEVTGGP